jgi:hypothetical protein
MTEQRWQDPLDFVHEWSLTNTVDVPVQSERDYALTALAAHASLLYDIPTASTMSKRELFYFVRSNEGLFDLY